MPAGYATVRGRYKHVDVRSCPQERVIVRATNLTHSACAEGPVLLMQMRTEFVTTRMRASVHSMHVAFATVLVQ